MKKINLDKRCQDICVILYGTVKQAVRNVKTHGKDGGNEHE